MDYLEVEEARDKPGLRLVLTEGVPGPWGEAAKGVFHVKRIPFLPVRQVGGDANDALVAWTGHANAPQAVLDDEPARIHIPDILLLAERLAPEPRLVPAEPRERVQMFGLLHELGGEMGLAWCRRLQLLHPILQLPEGAAPAPLVESIGRLGARYGYSPEQAAAADVRVKEILSLFSQILLEQRNRGSDFFIGDSLTALDIYWATFAAMVKPLPPEQCPMSDMLRGSYTLTDPDSLAAADPILLEHRDRIYRDVLPLPLDF